MTTKEDIKLQRGMYSAKGEDIAQLLPVIYRDAREDYKSGDRKCLIQILVPTEEKLKEVDRLISATALGATRENGRHHLMQMDYDVIIKTEKDYTSTSVIDQFKKEMTESRTISMLLYGEVDIAIEEFIIDKFFHEGNMVGMLVN